MRVLATKCMRKLPPPTDDATDVYTLCVSGVQNLQLRGRLQKLSRQVGRASERLLEAGKSRTFYQLKPQQRLGQALTARELAKLYDLRMARKRSAGRGVYDRLMAAAPHMRCPLCGQRDVSTLDHYLSKMKFPIFAVTPINLIPACANCNKIKLDRIATTVQTQTLHPYFDDVENDCWLSARVEEVSPPSVEFLVVPPDHWDGVLAARIRAHFDIFDLGKLYRAHAASELASIEHRVATLHAQAGSAAVRLHLMSEAESRSVAHRNSWQTAMYWALTTSDWYCDVGFNA